MLLKPTTHRCRPMHRMVHPIHRNVVAANQTNKANRNTVYLVDAINVESSLKHIEKLYVLSDVPKVKDATKTLGYTFLETHHGVLASTNQDMMKSIKVFLDLPHYVIAVGRQDYDIYISYVNSKSRTVVIYNAYCDIYSKSTYFLYFTL